MGQLVPLYRLVTTLSRQVHDVVFNVGELLKEGDGYQRPMSQSTLGMRVVQDGTRRLQTT